MCATPYLVGARRLAPGPWIKCTATGVGMEKDSTTISPCFCEPAHTLVLRILIVICVLRVVCSLEMRVIGAHENHPVLAVLLAHKVWIPMLLTYPHMIGVDWVDNMCTMNVFYVCIHSVYGDPIGPANIMARVLWPHKCTRVCCNLCDIYIYNVPGDFDSPQVWIHTKADWESKAKRAMYIHISPNGWASCGSGCATTLHVDLVVAPAVAVGL